MKLIRKRNLYYASLLPDLDRDIILPKIPDNFLTRGRFAEYKIKRNCLYTTIDDALSSFLGQDLEGSVVYIYEPVGIKPDNLIEADITKIPYALSLPELWYCNSMRVRLTHIIKVGKKKKTMVYHYGSRQTVAKIYKWHWNEKLDKYGNSMVIKKFSEQPEEEKRPKVSNKAIGLAIAGTTAGAAIGNKVAKNVRLGAAQKKTAAALDKSTLASHLKNHDLVSDASASWRREHTNIRKAGEDALSKITKQHKTAGKVIGLGALAAGAALAGKAIHEKKKEEEKRYSLFGDIIRGAISGAAREINKDSGGNWDNTTGIIFGTLFLSRFIDASRYLNKDYTYTVKTDGKVSAKEDGSTISWEVNELFEKFDTCPDDWSSFTIWGKASKGDFLNARIITKQGKTLEGKVLVEVR